MFADYIVDLLQDKQIIHQIEAYIVWSLFCPFHCIKISSQCYSGIRSRMKNSIVIFIPSFRRFGNRSHVGHLSCQIRQLRIMPTLWTKFAATRRNAHLAIPDTSCSSSQKNRSCMFDITNSCLADLFACCAHDPQFVLVACRRVGDEGLATTASTRIRVRVRSTGEVSRNSSEHSLVVFSLS